MWDDDLIATFAAASETVLPSSTSHGVHNRVIDLFNAAMPGYPILVQSLLDAYAAEASPGSTFAGIDDEGRSQIFRAMMEDASNDVRDVVDGLFLFTLGQTYNEANPEHPAVWAKIGYHGPSEGVADWNRQEQDA